MGAGRSRSLLEAIDKNDVAVVKAALRHKKRPISPNDIVLGESYLFRAVTAGSTDVAKLLIEHGAIIHSPCTIKNKEGCTFEWTIIHEACRKGDIAMLSALIDAGADVNASAQYQMTPLHIAAWHGHKDVVVELTRAGCDVTRLDAFCESALVIPICHGDTPIVEALLLANCKLTSRSWGNTRKIRGKYEADYRDTLYGRHGPYSLFFLAIKYSWIHIAGLLLQHGSNPNKYQIHDLLKNIKSNLGKFDSEGARLIVCLIACGYRLSAKDDKRLAELMEQDDFEYYDQKFVVWLRSRVFQVSSLKQLCRASIRSMVRVACGHVTIIRRLQGLFLPRTLIDYLCLKNFDYSCQETSLDQSDHLGYHRDPLYLAMPRRQPQYNGKVSRYLQFWKTSCCFSK